MDEDRKKLTNCMKEAFVEYLKNGRKSELWERTQELVGPIVGAIVGAIVETVDGTQALDREVDLWREIREIRERDRKYYEGMRCGGHVLTWTEVDRIDSPD